VVSLVESELSVGPTDVRRKRVSIAEALLSGAPLQCWDNSTRGLDSANAVEFCKTLRLSTEMSGCTAVVAIYQAPQDAYDVFDKVALLYEGEQIFFGPTTEAKQFFLDMGFVCPEQQTTPDFLTSLTSPAERRAREGMEHEVPKTPKEFSAAWKASTHYKALRQRLDAYDERYPIGGEHLDAFLNSRRAQQSKHM
jgi:ATP-binding cassette subfamily G (WHITE) protein 2 (PDR)